MSKPVRPIDQAKIMGLIEVSRGTRPASTWIRGGQVLNVYTGELDKADIVLFEDRIAYIGTREPRYDQHTVVLDAAGFVLVPGYIEPHAHPFQMYNLQTLGEFALRTGTTTLINDNLVYFLNMEPDALDRLLEYSRRLPVKNFWWARVDPQSNQPEMLARFSSERLVSLLNNKAVIQAGELTSWPALLAGDPVMLEGIAEARRLGKRIEGHHPGASADTLNTMAALGVTACHEAINGEEALRRLRLGMYCTLRHSSIRPDLPAIIRGLTAMGFDFSSAAASRLMMTTDGSMPPFHRQGMMDYLIRLAIEQGVPAAAAYRMASLNPAVYYGLDQELGGLAPGRIADILFLHDLHAPTPVKVMADGRMVAEQGRLLAPFPACDWANLSLEPMSVDWRATPEWFELQAPEGQVPVLEMLNAVILQLRYEEWPPGDGGTGPGLHEGYCYASLIDRHGKWITNAIIKGFACRLEALVTTYTASQDVLVIGQDKRQMAQAVNELLAKGGGMLLSEGGRSVFHLPLPLGGKMSTLNMEELIAETSGLVDLLQERGYAHLDPFYSLFFLSATHLPYVRLTQKGVFSIKEKQVVFPAKKL